MTYNKKLWIGNEIITSNALNNIENGIYTVNNELEQVKNSIPKKTSDLTNDSGFMTQLPDLFNLRRNNQLAVAEILSIAKSYYDNRYCEDGVTPRFIYNQHRTPFSDKFDVTDPDYGGAIDCSTFIGLLLRGLPVWKSPYIKLFGDKFIDSDEEHDGVDDGVVDDNNTNIDGDDNQWDSYSIVENDEDYLWAINPFNWSMPILMDETDKHPVRRASQLAQWMEELGWSIPFDSKFTTVEPGDIIFWAKKNSQGEYVNPKRYKQISHVAICSNKMTPPEDYPEGYPIKHTMYEVTTKAPYVLNRSLEKCSPDKIVMICRPDLGALNPNNRVCNLTKKYNITNINNMFYPGHYYLTSLITEGLPDGIETGIYLMLEVTRTLTRLGKVYSLQQRLINAKKPDGYYIRTQYCYSHLPNKDEWTPWTKLLTEEDLNKKANLILEDSDVFVGSKGLSLKESATYKQTLYENKFDRDMITKGYFNQADGSLTLSNTNWISQKMNVENVKTVIITNFSARPTRLNEYDKDGTFIKRSDVASGNLEVELNNDTYYILIGSHDEALDNIRMYYIYKNSEYKIDDEIFTLINEQSFNNKSITVNEHYFIDAYTKTKYWITHIPRYDAYGDINELKLGFANNMINGDIFSETARSFANRNNATVCINAGVSWDSYGGNTYYNKDGQKCNKMHGLRVYDHMLVSNDIESNWYKKTHYALGITDDGLLVSFGDADANGDITMSYEESQELGCKFVTSAFTPIMLDGVSQKNVLQYKNQWVNEDGSNIYYQRQIIGQNSSTKDIFILTSNGKGTNKNAEGLIIDSGMTLDACITILKSFGCDFAYQLDEGGSASLVYRGQLVNDKTDNGMKTERKLSDFLYVASAPTNDRDRDIKYIQEQLGELKEQMGIVKKLFLDGETDSTREIQRWVNGSLTHSLNLKSNSIQYYDSKNKQVIFQADNQGFISTVLGNLGYFPKQLTTIKDTDFPNYNTVFVYPAEIEGAPYQDIKGFVIHLVWGSDNQMQIAFPFATTQEDDKFPKYRTKTIKDDTYSWNDWNGFILNN